MGTRAQFFIGNPEDLDSRRWLGCVAWDGYPDGDCGEHLIPTATADEFEAAVRALAEKREDFTDPEIHSFPFPWDDDLFLTDYTYAIFDGCTQVTCYHGGWRRLNGDLTDAWKGSDELPGNVKAPTGGGELGPDSIMILRM